MSQDIDLHTDRAGRCFKRHLPKGTRFVVLLIEPDGNGYCCANLPDGAESIDRFLTDFGAKFNFYHLSKLKLIQIIP